MKPFVLVLFLLLVSTCATIPQESVDLSSAVGVGLEKQHQSQIELINLYFSVKRKSLDGAMNKALASYFEGLTPSGTMEMTRRQVQDVAEDVMDFNSQNNAAKEELENARVLLISKLNENYFALSLANTSVTGLLESAVAVKNSRFEAFESLSKSTQGKVDLGKVLGEIDEFTKKGGKEAGKAIKLVDRINAQFDEKKKENK